MEFVMALADLRAEASCPICLDYLKDPVTISCGHNFCLSCIIMSWKDLHDSFPCPFCHFCCPERKFISNPQLGSLTEIAKQLQIRSKKRKRQEESAVCKKHKSGFDFLLSERPRAFMSKCSLSTDHQHHCVAIKKDASLHRKNWRNTNATLITMQTRKSLELKKK
uniref:RING-type domain-containing protein n=1 Tax=Pan troglodytes TaxID=9598 RepID=A0A2I3SBQ1_PANTR